MARVLRQFSDPTSPKVPHLTLQVGKGMIPPWYRRRSCLQEFSMGEPRGMEGPRRRGLRVDLSIPRPALRSTLPRPEHVRRARRGVRGESCVS